jgi:hypothetical protein
MSQVHPESLDNRQACPLAIAFLDLLDAANPDQRLPARFLLAQALPQLRFHFAFNQALQFVVEIGFQPAPPNQRHDSGKQRANLSHREPPNLWSIFNPLSTTVPVQSALLSPYLFPM